MKKNLNEYYKVGNQIADVRFGRHGDVVKVTKQTVTFKFSSSTQHHRIHLGYYDEFVKSYQII